MKIITTLIVLFTCLFYTNTTMAQKSNEAICKIKTSAQCFMCKERIEKDLAYEKGVSSSDLNLDDMILTVKYNPKKTTADKIRQRVAKIGYDADGLPADMKAYKQLPLCCQKGEHPELMEQHKEGDH